MWPSFSNLTGVVQEQSQHFLFPNDNIQKKAHGHSKQNGMGQAGVVKIGIVQC